jgi:hypothetical protein
MRRWCAAAFAGERPLDRTALLVQPRSVRQAVLVDVGLGAEPAAQFAMMLSVIVLVREPGPDAGRDGKGGREQPLERQGVIDIRRRDRAGDRHAVASGRDVMYLVPRLPRSVGLGPVRSSPRFGCQLHTGESPTPLCGSFCGEKVIEVLSTRPSTNVAVTRGQVAKIK